MTDSFASTLSHTEWMEIISGAGMASALVIAASPSGLIGLSKEFTAMYISMREQAAAGAMSSPFLNGILVMLSRKPSAEDDSDAKAFAETHQESARNKTPEEVKADAFARLDAAAALVGERLGESQVPVFKEFAYKAARAVAEASKEGGFLGIGGVVISEQEEIMLGDLAAHFGIDV